MSLAIQSIGIRSYNSIQKNNSIKVKGNQNVSFGILLSTPEDKILAGLGAAGGLVTVAGILNKLGIENIINAEMPILVTVTCAFLPLIAALGIFGSRIKPS